MAFRERCVYVTGLSADTNVKDLEKLFCTVGVLERSALIKNDKEVFTGTAFVCLRTKEEALAAAMQLSKDGITVQAVSKDQIVQLEDLFGDGSDLLLTMYQSLSEETKRQFLLQIMGEATKQEPLTGAIDKSSAGVTIKREEVPGLSAQPVGAIVSAFPNVIVQEPPKLSVFSGLPGKDASFGRWKYEVACLQLDRSLSENNVLNAIRRSLRSPAADVITHLDQNATLQTLLGKLESVYGTVLSGQALLQKFYSETQSIGEDVALWACRLEDLGFKAEEKKVVTRTAVAGMLKAQFWSGLRDHRIKDTLRQHKDTLEFESLVIEARELEEEYKGEHMGATSAGIKQQHNKPTEMEMLTQLVKKIEMRMEKMEQVINKPLTRMPDPVSLPAQQQTRSSSGQTQQGRPGSAVCDICHQEGHLSFGCRHGTTVQCYKCGRQGHVSRACRSSPLNG